MTWYETPTGRKVHAAAGSGLAEVYGYRYKLLGADDDVAVDMTTDPPRLTAEQAAEVAQVIADETSPEYRPVSRMRLDELAQAARDAGLDDTGTVAELRARLNEHQQTMSTDEH